MKASCIKNSTVYFFLIIFLSIKLVGLHVLTHTEEKDKTVSCEVCDHAITHNLLPLLTPDLEGFEIEVIKGFIEKEIIKKYRFIVSNSIAADQLFSRPPPFLTLVPYTL